MDRFYVLPLLIGLAISCVTPSPPASIPAQPNILFMIADDWSYPHASILGDPVVQTPTFDRVAQNGVLFHNAYCAAPSCSPSRASILSGRYPHQLEAGGNLWSVYPQQYDNFVDLLQDAGYHTGSTRKGWGPGDYQRVGYDHNPAGKTYPGFKDFFDSKPDEAPFFFWFGSSDPHRVYTPNSGVRTGMDAGMVNVPPFLPDLPCIRNDILDYFYEVERFDRECGNILTFLQERGELDHTIVVITSDNGMPFPRAKANLYDYGTRMPMAMCWTSTLRPNQVMQDFVSLVDLAPTFLEAAQRPVPTSMSGYSLLPDSPGSTVRDKVFIERERHANVRKGDLSYPMRAVRTKDYLYIHNFEPERWPAGDPKTHVSVGQFGDVDNSISKFLIMSMEGQEHDREYFNLSFGKRTEEEFYVLADDPGNIKNQIRNKEYAQVLEELRQELVDWMQATDDLRSHDPNTIYWDTVEYTPTYQFFDFDLTNKLAEYQMERREGNRFMPISCSQSPKN
ncbi:MAG: sulfatase [Saprospiraceae bacterium]|nr:sulfatase [Saprospiraceae bacterium]